MLPLLPFEPNLLNKLEVVVEDGEGVEVVEVEHVVAAGAGDAAVVVAVLLDQLSSSMIGSNPELDPLGRYQDQKSMKINQYHFLLSISILNLGPYLFKYYTFHDFSLIKRGK